MGFVFRAAFWFAVVGAFMPRDVHAEDAGAALPPSGEAVFDAAAVAARFCADQPEVCAVSSEAASIGRAVTGSVVRVVLDEDRADG